MNKNCRIESKKVLLIGKAGEKIASWANDNSIKIIFVGLFGRHKEKLSPIGATVSYLAKNLKCDLFIADRNLKHNFKVKIIKNEIKWDPESEEELKKLHLL